MAQEITIRDIKFDVGNVDAFTQLFISRKTSPFFLKWNESSSFDEALSDIPEEDMQAILKRILPYIKREVQGNWFPIYNAPADRMMYEDINGADILKLLFFVLEIYLKPFFAEPDQKG
jgi:hypothetical protein